MPLGWNSIQEPQALEKAALVTMGELWMRCLHTLLPAQTPVTSQKGEEELIT